MKLKRLPIGIQSFRKLREGDYLYVDKTMYIHKLITENDYIFLSRPRRFGKSLMISTIGEIFRGNRELFKGLWIYDKWDFKPHPVILFDFNSISHDNPDEFKKSLIFHMKLQAEDYGIELPEKETPKDVFDYFIKALYKKYQTGVVVLVDEYDKPILDHLGEGEERLKIAYANRDILKNFFGDVLLMEVSDLNLKPRALADDLGFALKNEEFEGVKGILNEILAEIPYTLFARADERLFHVVFYLVLNVLGLMPRQSFLLTEDA